MDIKIETYLEYYFNIPSDILLQIEAAGVKEQIIRSANINVVETDHFQRVSSHDYIGERIWVKRQGSLKVKYNSLINLNRQPEDLSNIPTIAPHKLPGNIIQYLLDSTYCPASSFQNFVQDEFGNLSGGERIIAMSEWIRNKVIYTLGSSDNKTNALNTFVERRGVCRDFAHLLISFARASTIPARIASVYAINVKPQDFHAVVEVYLDGKWYLIDPTGMAKPEEMAIIGVGRDAVDVGFLTSYGYAQFVNKIINVRYA